MPCPACKRENLEDAKFCEHCGTQLVTSCPRCGTVLRPVPRFCRECGMPQAIEPAAPHLSPPSPRPPPVGSIAGTEGEDERRHLTVLFCDIVGSTQLSSRLDAEDLHDLLRDYQGTCAEVIRKYEGHIAQYLGDGLLVYFGYPLAHEDDAMRATHAGLGILENLRSLNARLEADLGIRVSVRIAIHSGDTVVGKIGGELGREKQVFGQTTNLAAHLQAVAGEDSLVVSEETLRLLRRRFHTEDLGTHRLKGIPEPVAVHRVLRPVDARKLPDGVGDETLSPFVGRDQETALLQDRWEQVREGAGQVVLLSGEAGIGKSRLLHVLRESLYGAPHTWLLCRCSAYHENSAFYPVADLLEQGMHLEREEGPEARLKKLEGGLEAAGFPLPESVPLFAALLSLPLPPGRYPHLALSAEAQRRRTLEALTRWVFSLADRRPSVVVMEDLHWIDPSSREVLDLLVERVAEARILLLLTFRPSFQPPWRAPPHLTHLTLHPLTRQQMATMVRGVAPERLLPDEVLRQVVARADGVPLFVEELTKAILESDLLRTGEDGQALAEGAGGLDIPSTLQDSLMARLDRLGPAKELAQLASVIGREFPSELIEVVSRPASPEVLRDSLGVLVNAGLLFRRGEAPHTTYIFKHALIQDTAYRSLLKGPRQEYHGRVARVLEVRFPERLDTEPEVVARHFEEAGLWAKAVHHYGRAGELATQRSAYAEGIRHLRRGIKLLSRLPPVQRRGEQELALQITLGSALIAVKGYGDPDVEKAYVRARELCQEIGKAPRLFESLWGLANYYQSRSELGTAQELAEELLRFAERDRDPSRLVWAHLQLGATLFWQGRPAEAVEHFEQTIGLHDPAAHAFLAGAPDPAVAACVYEAVALWQTGHPDRGLERSREGVERARVSGHPFSLAIALDFAGVLHQLRGERTAVREIADEVIALSREQEFPLWLGMGRLLRGWALADSPDGVREIEDIHQALTDLAATGTEVGAPGALLLLAEAYLTIGRADDALRMLDAALAVAEEKQQLSWHADMLRLKGEALIARDSSRREEAEQWFRRSLDVAGAQRAISFELRAATCLSRLLCARGSRDEARRLLAERYERFTEGFETQDLRVARELLEEMDRAAGEGAGRAGS